jgi:hypothetical protein
MRTNARSLPGLAAALLLAASAATVSSCCCRKVEAPPPVVVRDPITVFAAVEYDGHKATMTTSQGLPDKLVRLSEQFHDTVHWLSASGEIHIVKWAQKRPFDKDPVHENKVLKSGHPSAGSAKEGGLKCKDNEGNERQCYDYVIELELPDAEHTRVKIDPRIEIMP